MKLSQLIGYNMKNIFVKKSNTEFGEKIKSFFHHF